MADPDEKVRVKDVATKHEYTITRARLEATPEAFAELDKPAVDVYGVDVPPKYHVDLKAAAVDYEGQTVAQLNETLATRNAERDADSQITADGRTKADLVAALVADDARTADASNQRDNERGDV